MKGKILVTGAMGYLGGRIARAFAKNEKVELLLATRKTLNKKPKWLSRGSMVSMDLASGDGLDCLCENVHTIIHLAAMNEVESFLNPEKALIVNTLGTLKLLQSAESAGVERFIYFSTAHVYRRPLTGEINEETIPRPTHPYAITHRAAEDFVLACSNKMKGIVIRLSNGVGAPENYDVNCWALVANDLCMQAVVDQKMVLKSSGLQYRNFIPIWDICRAVEHLTEAPIKQLGDRLFNLGSEHSLRIIDLAELIQKRCEKIFEYKPEIHRNNSQPLESHPVLDYSIDKIKSTGFTLEGSIDTEIDHTLKLCRQVQGKT